MKAALQLAPFLAPALGALLALALDAWGRRGAAVALAATGLAAGSVVAFAAAQSTQSVQPVVGVFAIGSGVSMLSGTIMLAGTLALCGGYDDLSDRTRGGAVAALAALGVTAAAAVTSSFDMVATLILVEATGISAYAIVASAATARSSEAAVKYFVQGSIATGAFVVGLGVLVASGGDASLGAAVNIAGTELSTPAVVGLSLIVVALALKAGAFPFHFWVPDAYETAPSAGTGVMASALKVGMLGGLVSVTLALHGPLSASRAPLAAIATASIVFGNLVALRQRSYARMLAYSGVAQVGYALVPIVLGQPQQAAFFLTTYAVAVVGAFAASDAVKRRAPDWDGTIDGLAGLSTRAPMLAASLATIVLSLTGIPPLLGFWGKLQAFGVATYAALGTGDAAWVWLAIIGLVGSVISFGYYGAVLRAMYFTGPIESAPGDRAAADETEADAVVPAAGADAQGADEAAARERRWGSADVVVVLCAGLLLAGGAAVLIFGQPAVVALFAYR